MQRKAKQRKREKPKRCVLRWHRAPSDPRNGCGHRLGPTYECVAVHHFFSFCSCYGDSKVVFASIVLSRYDGGQTDCGKSHETVSCLVLGWIHLFKKTLVWWNSNSHRAVQTKEGGGKLPLEWNRKELIHLRNIQGKGRKRDICCWGKLHFRRAWKPVVQHTLQKAFDSKNQKGALGLLRNLHCSQIIWHGKGVVQDRFWDNTPATTLFPKRKWS